MGYAAAIAFVLFIVILIATLIQFRLQKDRTE
jgi:ABC-type sugar transport system permease subunit